MRFAKGHGTGNDFVILPDLDGALELSPVLVARICDRHFGIGADGVLRVVRTLAARGVGEEGPARHGAEGLARQGAEGLAPGTEPPEWFMDYRNSDGSVAEMCGNGVRVFARYLIDEGLADGPEVAVATRAGVRIVRAETDGQFTVDMGPAVVLGAGAVRVGELELDGVAISVGNPHVACVIDQPVATIDLSAPTLLAPADLRTGANVEVLRQVRPREIEMRVHERGSGLTLSCGTGAVAAAVAAAAVAGEWPDGPGDPWTVHVPGGRLAVTPSPTASLLTGPAEIVAVGELAESWLSEPAPAL